MIFPLLLALSLGSALQAAALAPNRAAIISETPPSVLVEPEGYGASDRKWQGIPSIEKTSGGRLWVSYFSGGEEEPSADNYVAFSYSDDDGETWIDPFIVIDNLTDNVRCYDPNVFYDPLGRMRLSWCQASGSYSELKTWSLVIDEPDAGHDSLSLAVSKANPRLIGDGVKLNRPLVLTNGEWLYFSASSTPVAISVWRSSDCGANWSLFSLASGNGYSVTEPMAVQKSDGTVVLLARIEKISGEVVGGGIGRFYSKDNGLTWSDFETDLEAPLRGPSSRFSFIKLTNGHLLFVNNASETSREKLTAYLSTDEGVTWSSSCSLDDRDGVSYPSAIQDKQGNIYVVYDKGRYMEKELRFSKFVESDIERGFLSSSNDIIRRAVSVLGTQKDIDKVETAFTKEINVVVGTPLSQARSSLPSEIKVLDEHGGEYTLNGRWSSQLYDPQKAGSYVFSFSSATDLLTNGLFDAHRLLETVVIVNEDQAKTTWLAVGLSAGAALVAASAAAAVTIAIKKRHKKGGGK